ncbi:MAG: serine/threonine protein kinase [Gammaproteobacteria bacterium]|nr:MAG: serine/threonine protein kinase [Gammaproteobacteria bacterium]
MLDRLGKYHVIKEIGRGAMGVVYLGHDPFLDRDVALKRARHSDFRDAEQQRLYRNLFFNEMRTAGLLRHPNIIEVFDAGNEDDEYYIVMEYVPGATTLDEHCQADHLLPVQQAAEVVFKCAQALDYAHRNGVIHRDIKPSNVLVGDDGRIKVGDFSVALLTDPLIRETQLMDPVGSPLYMSPEQLKDEPVTNQSDLYALGVVMFELLTGHHPFPASNLPALTQRVLNDAPIALERYRPDVPSSLANIVARALQKDLADRYSTALEFAADLSQSFSELVHPEEGIGSASRVDRLRCLSFFQALRDAEIWELLRWARWEEVAPGEAIVSEGEQGNAFYVVVSGTVVVMKGTTPVVELGEGQCFGEMAYLAHGIRTATVSATDAVTVLRMNVELIERATLACQVQFQKVFIETLVERLEQTTEALAHAGTA